MKNPLKLITIILSLLMLLFACEGSNGKAPNPPPISTGKWTWVSGSNQGSQRGSYGIKGIANSSNVPGARAWSISWTDSLDNLWIFGGVGFDSAGNTGYLNDLWKFNTATAEWTWVSGSDLAEQAGVYGTKGIADPLNIPGARTYAISWLDSQDNLWLFGGDGYDSTGTKDTLNDLWKYDPTTLEWTWISGSNLVNQTGTYGTKGTADPQNMPGARGGSVSWIGSSGNLWLFGGFSWPGWLNDLWKYDLAANEWTWVSGSNMVDQAGTYGTRGMGASSNVPGGRYGSVSWLDSHGNFWLFGGPTYDQAGNLTYYINDLWKYNPTTLEWTWISGSNLGNQPGNYGTKGIASLSNIPGARGLGLSWLDSQGKLWLFGGSGLDSTGDIANLNDLWVFDPTSVMWAWISGSNLGYQPGNYGTKGIAASSNVPGSRYVAVSWIDSQGRFWLFGGLGSDSQTVIVGLNDLWRYIR